MSRKTIVILLSLGLAATAACKSEIDNKPAATVAEVPVEAPVEAPAEAPAPAAEPVAAPAPAVQHVESPVLVETSTIEFVGAKVTGDHKGGFKEWSGAAHFDAQGNAHKVAFEVKMASTHSDAEKLTGHLLSPDFFDAEKFPTSKFESTKVEAVTGQPHTHNITGNLTLKDVTKEISFPATLKAVDGKWVATSEFTLNRMDFGITYPGKADDLIKPEVLLKLNLQAALPSADKFGAAQAQ